MTDSSGSTDKLASRFERLSQFSMWIVVVLGAMVVLMSSSVLTEDAQSDRPPISMEARASLAMCEDPEVSVGAVELVERASDEGIKLVDVYIRVEGLAEEAGKHAVHIHETGSCSPCSDAGGHFDPGPHGHSHPDGNHPFHAGDLVNIKVDDSGNGELVTTTSRITLSAGPLSIFDDDGASLIIHVDPDSYCPGGEEAGCAGGARLACGIFEVKDSS